MVLVYVLVCSVPVLIIVLVSGVIGLAGSRAYRTARQAYSELKPHVDSLGGQALRLQGKSADLSSRATRLGEAFQEIGARWAFIGDAARQMRKSPVVRAADMAGRRIWRQPEQQQTEDACG